MSNDTEWKYAKSHQGSNVVTCSVIAVKACPLSNIDIHCIMF